MVCVARERLNVRGRVDLPLKRVKKKLEYGVLGVVFTPDYTGVTPVLGAGGVILMFQDDSSRD